MITSMLECLHSTAISSTHLDSSAQASGLATNTLKLSLALAFAIGLGGCSAAATGSSEDGAQQTGGTEAGELGTQSDELSLRAKYFTAERDLRKCAFPLCGGYFVAAVNRPFTRCADGSYAERCYVATIDWTRMGGDPNLDAATVVVQGSIRAASYPEFGNLGVFEAEHAWGSATDAKPTGLYFGLRDNGIVCITEPCFSFDTELLNFGLDFQLSNLDFSAVGASEEQLEQAGQALRNGNLLATGRIRPVQFPNGTGLQLNASQFFLPAPEPTRCYSNDDCTDAEVCNAAEICLPPPGCDPGEACADVCTGFCVPAAVSLH